MSTQEAKSKKQEIKKVVLAYSGGLDTSGHHPMAN